MVSLMLKQKTASAWHPWHLDGNAQPWTLAKGCGGPQAEGSAEQHRLLPAAAASRTPGPHRPRAARARQPLCQSALLPSSGQPAGGRRHRAPTPRRRAGTARVCLEGRRDRAAHGIRPTPTPPLQPRLLAERSLNHKDCKTRGRRNESSDQEFYACPLKVPITRVSNSMDFILSLGSPAPSPFTAWAGRPSEE